MITRFLKIVNLKIVNINSSIYQILSVTSKSAR